MEHPPPGTQPCLPRWLSDPAVLHGAIMKTARLTCSPKGAAPGCEMALSCPQLPRGFHLSEILSRASRAVGLGVLPPYLGPWKLSTHSFINNTCLSGTCCFGDKESWSRLSCLQPLDGASLAGSGTFCVPGSHLQTWCAPQRQHTWVFLMKEKKGRMKDLNPSLQVKGSDDLKDLE